MRSIALATLVLATIAPLDGRAAQCSFDMVLAVRFGAYDPLEAAPLDSTGSLTIDCKGKGGDTPFVVLLGRGSSGSYATRTMRGPGGATLGYNLYLDATRLTIWGDGTGGSTYYGPTAIPSVVTIPVYGRIPAYQAPAAGSYADTITITVEF